MRSAFAETLQVAVSILPQEYFVKKIGGDFVSVTVLVPPGASPENYELKPRQMTVLSECRIYFAIGVPFEAAWLPKISSGNQQMTIVRTDEGIRKIAMTAHHHHEGDGSHDEESSDGSLDPHIWLSPPLVKIQANHILKALQQADPIHSNVYEVNFNRFSEEIDRLDADLRTFFTGFESTRFMVFHPAWGYFASEYGLEQIPIESEGKDPKPAQLMSLINEARAQDIKVVFAQPQFSTRSAETIAKAIGGEVIPSDDLAPDWEENLRRQAVKIKSALK